MLRELHFFCIRKSGLTFIFLVQAAFFYAQYVEKPGANTKDSLITELKKMPAGTSKTGRDSVICEFLVSILDLETSDKEKEKYSRMLRQVCERNLSGGALSREMTLYYNKTLAGAYNNLGYLDKIRGNIPGAFEKYHASIRIIEKTGAKELLVINLLNLANLYHSHGEQNNALQYARRGLAVSKEINDLKRVASAFNALGAMTFTAGQLDESLQYYDSSLSIFKSLKNKKGIALATSNMAGVYMEKKEFLKAEKFYFESLALRRELNDENFIGNAYYSIAFLKYVMKQYGEAEKYALTGFELAKKAGRPAEIRSSSKLLYKLNTLRNNYREALAYYEIFIQMRDSVNNESTRKASIRSQLKYEYEKQAAADSVAHAKESEIKSAELSRQSAELRAKKNQQYALFGGLALVMIFAGFMFNRFKVTQKQKSIIEHQKEEVEEQKKLVEEKQKEILDSIYYARRIQMAQVPSEKRVQGMMGKLRKG